MRKSTLSLLILCACGTGATVDVAAYQQSVAALEAAVTTHQADSANTATTQDCIAEHQRYEDSMRDGLAKLTSASPGMDDCRTAMGHKSATDLRGMCGSMRAELERHGAVACTGEAAANHAEAAHHCQFMRDWLSQQRTETDTMRGGRCGR